MKEMLKLTRKAKNVDLKDFDKAIVVSDKDYFPLLYSFRNSHPELQMKIWNEEDLLRRLSCSFDKGKMDPIPYLLKKGITYPNAKKYLNLIRVADISKNVSLASLYKELDEKGYLKFDELGGREISLGRVFLLEKQEDLELHSLLERNGIPARDLAIQDLGIKPSLPDNSHPPIYLFEDKFYQFSYLFSSLRRRLLENPDDSSHIVITSHDVKDQFYAELGSSLYELPASFNVAVPLLSSIKVKKKISEIHSSKSFFFTEEEKKDEDLNVLYDLVNHYGLAELDSSFGYAALLDILSANEVRQEPKPGVAFTSSYILDPNLIFYVTNFQYGDFYAITSDKSVLSDDELVKVSANPSYVKTELDKRKKKNFLKYNNIVFLSRVAKHLTDKIYDSPFLEELGWKKDVEKKRWNEEGVFTSESEKLYRADQLDSLFYHKPFEDLLNYDHSYKKVEDRPLIQNEKWSASKLERFIVCPFQYLLNAYFPFDPSASRNTASGQLNHFMMEHLYSDEFDFDARFEEGAKAYRQTFEQNHQPFTAEEEGFLAIYKYWLRKCMDGLRLLKKQDGVKLSEKAECNVSYTLKDSEGECYLFSGRVDKILFVSAGEKSYYAIVDYKSGAETFEIKNVFLGGSTQLPLYALALKDKKNANLIKGATFAGFGIHHSYLKNIHSLIDDDWIEENVCTKKMKFEGPLYKGVDFWEGLDPTAFKKGQKELKSNLGDYFNSKNLFENESKDSLFDNGIFYTMDNLLEDAKRGLLLAIKMIRSNEFPIMPTSMNLEGDYQSLACGHCSYGDVCYRNKTRDSVSYHDLKNEHFVSTRDEESKSDED